VIKQCAKHLYTSVSRTLGAIFYQKKKQQHTKPKKWTVTHWKKIILHTEFSEICKPKKHNLTNLHQILNKIIGKKYLSGFDQFKTQSLLIEAD